MTSEKDIDGSFAHNNSGVGKGGTAAVHDNQCVSPVGCAVLAEVCVPFLASIKGACDGQGTASTSLYGVLCVNAATKTYPTTKDQCSPLQYYSSTCFLVFFFT